MQFLDFVLSALGCVTLMAAGVTLTFAALPDEEDRGWNVFWTITGVTSGLLLIFYF